MPWLHLSKDKLIILKGKKKLSQFLLHDFVINGKVDLDLLFPKLENIASNMGLTTSRLSVNDSLLNTPVISIETFKNKGNGLLKRLTIVLLPKKKRKNNNRCWKNRNHAKIS